MENIKSSIFNKEMRRRSQSLSSSSQSEVMIADSRGRSQSRGFKSRDKVEEDQINM